MSKGPAFLFTVFNRLTKSEIRPLTSPTARIFKDLQLPPSALPLIFLDFKPYLFLTLRELQISPDVKPDQPDVLERFFQIFQSSFTDRDLFLFLSRRWGDELSERHSNFEAGNLRNLSFTNIWKEKNRNGVIEVLIWGVIFSGHL